MANKKQQKQENTLKSLLDRFRVTSKLSTQELYGTDEKFHDETNNDLMELKNTISTINSIYKSNVGDDITEFYLATEMKNSNNKRKNELKTNNRQINSNIAQLVNNPESFNLNEIFSQESGRFQLYNSYNLIYENIPQMTQALNTYVDNIMSPDDFTKSVFNIYINNVITTAKNNNNADVIKNCEKLKEIYDIENVSKKIITDTLKLGDQFIAVLNLEEEMEKMVLSESSFTDFESSKKLTENDIVLSENDIQELSEMLTSSRINIPIKPSQPLSENTKLQYQAYDESIKKFNEASHRLKHDLAEIINENVKVYDSPDILLEDNFNISREFNTNNENLFNNTDFNRYNKKVKTRNNDKSEKINMRGSVIKILKPERIVKLSLDNYEYGYYYIENVDNGPDFLTTGTYSINSNIFTNFRTQASDQPDIINAKYKLISDIFVKNLAKKIDKKFINSHPEFKETIYNLVKQNYIINKQIRVIYLRPSDVIHFGTGSEEYKDSLYKQILFSAKLYLAVLTSQVMLRLVRSPEKRAFYISCDLDNDTEAVVQSFIRDSKTKDIKMSNFGQDINTLLQNIGTFQD